MAENETDKTPKTTARRSTAKSATPVEEKAPGNADLKVSDDNRVLGEDDRVASKTTPNLRAETSTDNSERFERDYTLSLVDTELTDDVRERQETSVRQEAVQRGLVPTGPVTLDEEIKADDGKSVRLIYSVPVELNTTEADVPQGLVAVAEQGKDTPADIPEKLDRKATDQEAERKDGGNA